MQNVVTSQSHARRLSKTGFAETAIRVKVAIFKPLKIGTDDALRR